MSERSGIGAVQIAILEALAAQPGRGFQPNGKLLNEAEDRIGLAPWYAYPVLVDLALPWQMPVTLIEGHGNYGSRGNDPPASRRYTESRLTDAGRLVLGAEHRDLAPVPVGLINGNTYRDGTQPPFQPLAVIAAIRHAIAHPDATSEKIVDIVGPPDFITGCTVTGDLAALAAGHPTELRLQAKITIADDREALVVENIPPNISTDDAMASISRRATQTSDQPSELHTATRLDLSSVVDEVSRHAPDGRIVCTPVAGVSPEEVRDQLARVYGVYTTMYVALPQSLPATIRHWVATNQAEDLPTSLTALETAIRNQPNPRY